ncbi:unnamed protein product [Larinioides sclopetarius]|uniref:Uncharacterized protein n=1 Tax=Larinioides sclopetarius TaxID=280406 RepID=A0AAV2BVR1_9ARAC
MQKYENSPPPSDYEYEDEPVFFTLPIPQRVVDPKFISIDYSLIHPILLGSKSEKNLENTLEDKTNEISQVADKEINKNENVKEVEQVNITENDELVMNAATDNISADKEVEEVKKRDIRRQEIIEKWKKNQLNN